MNDKTVSAVIVGISIVLAGGLLWWLLGSPTEIEPIKRVTDVEAETLAGTLNDGSGSAESTVDIEGFFEEFAQDDTKTSSSWPGFRGHDFTNILTEGPPLAESWPEEGPPVLWTVELGEGHSGAAVQDGKVYILDYDEEKEGDSLRCFSLADGKELWRRWYKAPTKKNHGVSRTVPAITEKYTVTIGPRCHVMCVDTETGAFRWGIDMAAEYGTEVPLWYTGQCPIIDDGVAIIAPVGSKLMIGVDCETGEVLWETPNDLGWNMSHSSIMPMTLLGKKTYVYCAIGGIFGVSAEEADRGKLLWSSNIWTHSVTSPSPLYIDDSRIFLTAGYGSGSMMLKLKEVNGAIEVEPIFELDKKVFGCEQQTPVYYEGHIFGILPKDAAALRGQFVCLNPDGEIVWSSGKQERFGLGPFMFADDKVFILDDNGELTLIKASVDKYEKLAHARVLPGHDAWAPMALVDGFLILRDSKRMSCLDVRAR